MKKWIMLLALGAIVAASAAMAQEDPGRNGIGLYLTSYGCGTCCSTPATTFPIYLVATNVSAPSGIIGWEMEISWDGPAIDEDYTIETVNGQYLNFETEPKFSVGLTVPLPNPSTFILLMTMEITVESTTEPVTFYIDGLRFAHSLPERVPAYAAGNNPANIVELKQSTGGADYPVLTLNGDCAVANEEMAWSSVKDLFR
jgi:hypothetical protein